MKTNKLFLATIILICILNSCSKNNDDIEKSSSSIIGKWKIIDYKEDSNVILEECEMLEVREFKSDNSLSKMYFYGNNCSNFGTNNWTFTISENTLFTKDPNGGLNSNNDYIINYNIIKLSSTTLIIEGFFVDEGVDGITPEETLPENRFTETWERI